MQNIKHEGFYLFNIGFQARILFSICDLVSNEIWHDNLWTTQSWNQEFLKTQINIPTIISVTLNW